MKQAILLRKTHQCERYLQLPKTLKNSISGHTGDQIG